jgi:DNA-binding transcriptional ArsR family regulator
MLTPELLFRALSDRTRLRCLLLLVAEPEVCVCEFVHALQLAQPQVSRHLARLRDRSLVIDERRGQWVYYRLDPNLPEWARKILEAAREAEQLGALQNRLITMPDRPLMSCQ